MRRRASSISYRAHDGHADQLRSLTLAAALARAWRRRLVLPPLAHHFDSPSCPTSQSPRRRWLRRPTLSSLLNLSALGVPFVEVANETGCGGGIQHTTCLVADPSWLSLHQRSESAALPSAGHVHFASLLFSQGKSCRFANWERVLAGGPCRIQYRADVLDKARAVLDRHLELSGRRSVLVAAHVRVLSEAAGKRDRQDEWLGRLVSLLGEGGVGSGAHLQVVSRTLYVATDDLTKVLPLAARTAAARSHRLLSRANLSTSELESVHPDLGVAALTMDIAAALHASHFAPSPRSGLSMHLVAMRRCVHGDGRCAPEVRHLPGGMASATACGGDLPSTIVLRPAPAEPGGRGSPARSSLVAGGRG